MRRSIYKLKVTDVHIGGDVHQIILDGIALPDGMSVLEQRDLLRDRYDTLRQIVLNEPRGGHPSLFANLIVPAGKPEAAAGFVIMEYLGYPLFSGSNTMATAIALVEEGRLTLADGVHDIVLESPGGLVDVRLNVSSGKVESVTYRPDDLASVVRTKVDVKLAPLDIKVEYDLVWAGCWYAVVAAEQLHLRLRPDEDGRQGQLAFSIMEALSFEPNPVHPTLGDQGPIKLVLFVDDPYRTSDGTLRRRISPVVYPRSVSRCPAGTGTIAAITQLVSRGQMTAGDRLESVSSWDTSFEGICENVGAGGLQASVTGRGWIIARKEIILDSSDPLTSINQIRDVLSRSESEIL